jgi:hypothetical protein
MDREEQEKLHKKCMFEEAVLTRMYRLWFFEPLLTFLFDRLDCNFEYDDNEKSLDIIRDNKRMLSFYFDDTAICITMVIHDDKYESIHGEEYLSEYVSRYVDDKFYCYGRGFKIMSFLPISRSNSIKYCTIEAFDDFSYVFDRKLKNFTDTHNVKELKIVKYECKNYKAIITYL